MWWINMLLGIQVMFLGLILSQDRKPLLSNAPWGVVANLLAMGRGTVVGGFALAVLSMVMLRQGWLVAVLVSVLLMLAGGSMRERGTYEGEKRGWRILKLTGAGQALWVVGVVLEFFAINASQLL